MMKSSTAHLKLAPDSAIDLQVHTVYSDGTWLPEQLINYLANEHFGLVAITDHDRVDTAAALQALALEKQLPVLIAVEMTCLWNGEMTDILCYGFDPEKDDLNRLALDIQRRQRENTEEVYANLLRKGFRFPAQPDADERVHLTAILELPGAQQPHALVALLKRHGCETPGKILMEAGVAFAANDVPAVVDAAHQSGAVCVLAHPGRADGFVCYDVDLLDQLRREVPFDGIETYYPLHTPEQTALYLDYARKHRLLVSSGSDSHGPENQPIPYRAGLSHRLLERVGIAIK